MAPRTRKVVREPGVVENVVFRGLVHDLRISPDTVRVSGGRGSRIIENSGEKSLLVVSARRPPDRGNRQHSSSLNRAGFSRRISRR